MVNCLWISRNQYDSPGIALADRSGADRRVYSRSEEVNPYYLAWCKATGTDPEEKLDSYHEFIIWIGQKHREYRKLKGLPVDKYPPGDYAEEFTAWLNEEVTR